MSPNFILISRVIWTDYDQSALLWSCTEYLKFFHLEYFWVFGRKPYLSEEKVKDLLEILTYSNIKTDYAVKTEQVGCN
jgi:apolipoprotein D and lipocalin family protein